MTRILAGGELFNLIFGSGARGMCWACPMDRGSAWAHPAEHLWQVHIFLREDVVDWRSRGARPVTGAHSGLLWQIRTCDEDACLDV